MLSKIGTLCQLNGKASCGGRCPKNALQKLRRSNYRTRVERCLRRSSRPCLRQYVALRKEIGIAIPQIRAHSEFTVTEVCEYLVAVLAE